jgi:DNA-binding SARP family transcriptional activator
MSRIDFRLLGPVSMSVDGSEIALGFPKQRLLLAALLAEVGKPIRTSQLVHRLWGSAPPTTARNGLYTYITQLRCTLAPHDVRLVKQRDTYHLDIDPDCVDMHRFLRLVGEARQSTADEETLDLLNEALDSYRATPLDGLQGPWTETIRVNLSAERRWALLRRNEILLDQGSQGEIVAELTWAAAVAPLDELLAGQLMVALHRSGQRAAAIRHYHTVRRALSDELGVNPGRPLQHVYESLLHDDGSAAYIAIAAGHPVGGAEHALTRRSPTAPVKCRRPGQRR